MRTSIQVGTLIGIPIRLHFTFLFILSLIVMMFAYGPTLSIGIDSPIHSLAVSLSAKDPYLFSIDAAGCAENLNKEVIPEELKEAFEIRGFSLPENANASKIEKKDNRWDIKSNEKVIYNIKKEKEKIDIYDLIPLPLGLGDLKISPFLRYFLSSVAAFLFFVSLLLHEMSHSYVAMKFGTKIHSITLFIFGGLAMMEDIPKSPEKEWRIAIAGPLMSFALGGVFLFSFWGIKGLNFAVHYPIVILMFMLGFLNVVLATFNLLPAFPMDGGRVLRAFLAKRMSFLKATKRAVLIGKTFAVIMAIAGFIADPFMFILTGERVTNFWMPLIAIFLYIAATEEEAATTTFTTLEGIKVKNIMRTERTSVPEDMPISELANKMLDEKTAEYAVVSESGELKGFITFDEIKKMSVEQRYFLKVSDAMSSFDSIIDIVFEDEGATEALKKMIRNRRNVLAVKKTMSGNFVGIITRRDLAIFMEMLKGSV